MDKFSLGRGISSLLGDSSAGENIDHLQLIADKNPQILYVPIEKLYPNPDQPRRFFDPAALEELSISIRKNGILQPILVRQHPRQDNAYEIIAGERRWQASQKARIETVPILIKNFNDAEVIEIALIENIHRRDLNPLEQAAGYKQLIDQFGYTQEKLAEVLARSRSHIANMLRLLSLPQEIQDYVSREILSIGHARALITLEEPQSVAEHIIKENLNVRETENLVRRIQEDPTINFSALNALSKKKKSLTKQKAPAQQTKRHVELLEQKLSQQIGLDIKISTIPNQQGGKVILQYKNLEEFDRIRHALENFDFS